MWIVSLILLALGVLLSLATVYMALLIMSPQGPPIPATEIQVTALVAFAVSSVGLSITGALLIR